MGEVDLSDLSAYCARRGGIAALGTTMGSHVAIEGPVRRSAIQARPWSESCRRARGESAAEALAEAGSWDVGELVDMS